jgi:hypothetical protein
MHLKVLALGVAAIVSQTPLSPLYAAAIDAAKKTIVHDIESTLPQIPFEAWMRGLVGARAAIEWEANDCGEQTGDPAVDRGRDFPLCAQAKVRVSGNRDLYLLLAVGTHRRGVTGRTASLHSGFLMQSGGRLAEIRKLTEVEGLLRGGGNRVLR